MIWRKMSALKGETVNCWRGGDKTFSEEAIIKKKKFTQRERERERERDVLERTDMMPSNKSL